jgi:hypothetical protein
MKTPLLAVLCGLILVGPLHAGPVVEAFGELPATFRDAQGDTIGGIGSAIVHDAATDRYLMVTDRGPGDGSLPYRPRLVWLKISRDGRTLRPEVIETILLKDAEGRPMTGLTPDEAESEIPRMKDGRTCIDPEALALASDGRIFVADEYGPSLYEFRADGTMVRRISLPEEFSPRDKNGHLDFTDTAELVRGRGVNQGPEGMCLLPGGKQAALIFQSAPVQHGGKTATRTPLVVIDLKTGRPVAAYWYPFSFEQAGVEPGKLSVNDLVCLDERRFLVLERDGIGRDGSRSPERAAFKSVWVADFRQATNFLAPHDTVIPAQKSLLLNLPDLVEDKALLAAKWEGLAVIPPSDDKTLTLLMTADNDFLAPVIHEDGTSYPFPRTKDAVPTQFFQIRAPLPPVP